MSDPDIRVEIIRSRTARSRPYRYIIRQYFTDGGFSLLANGGPYELEATARKVGEKHKKYALTYYDLTDRRKEGR